MMRTLTPILSLVIAILLFFFFVKPQYAETMMLQDQIDEYVDAVKKYKDFTTSLETKLNIKNSRDVLQSERLDQLVSEDIDDTRVIVDLEAMVKRHNMLFGNVTSTGDDTVLSSGVNGVAGGEVSAELSTVDISFEVIGTYDQFKSFLTDLESSLTLFEVVSLGYTANEGNFQQFALTVRTYALPK